MFVLLIVLASEPKPAPDQLLQMLPPACSAPTPGMLAYQEPLKRIEKTLAESAFPEGGGAGMFGSLLTTAEEMRDDKPTEKDLEEIAPEMKQLEALEEQREKSAARIKAAKTGREADHDLLRADHEKRRESCQRKLECTDAVLRETETRWLELRKRRGAREAELFAEDKRNVALLFDRMTKAAARAQGSKNPRLRRHGQRLQVAFSGLQMTIVGAFAMDLRRQCDDMNTLFARSRPE